MNIRLDGKTALVCGSSQGIGLSIAMMLAESGANIIAFARNNHSLESLVASLPNNGNQFHRALVADFSSLDEVKKVLKTIEDITIHILINNTGGPPPGNISNAHSQEFYDAFTRLLVCSHEITMHVLPGMKKEGWGRIINIISTSVRQPLDGLGVSNTIRGATASWAKTLSNEVAAYGITVNSILPGATKTGRLTGILQKKAADNNISVEEASVLMAQEIPMKRLAEPKDIAASAVFLSSDFASYITGITLLIDGGRTKAL